MSDSLQKNSLNAVSAQKKLPTEAPLVSVFNWSFNHSQFIQKSIDSILFQKTTFPVEIIVHDDASTDGTQKLLRDYESLYPDIFCNIYQEVNQWELGQSVMTPMLTAPRGEYVALTHGDDYWTDPLKLQKQVFLLQQNPTASFCFHNTKIIIESEENIEGFFTSPKKTVVHTLDDLFSWNFIHTSSIVFRKSLLDSFPDWYSKAPMGDWPLCILLAEKGNFLYINELMSTYRKHAHGTWSAQSGAEIKEKICVLFDQLMTHFSAQKKYFDKAKSSLISNCLATASEYKNAGNYSEANFYHEKALELISGIKTSSSIQEKWNLKIISNKDLKKHREAKNYQTSETSPFAVNLLTQSAFASNEDNFLHKIFGKKRINLLVFADEPGVGGVGHYAHSILMALTKCGANVFSAQPEWKSPLIEEQKKWGVQHLWTSYNPVNEFVRSFSDIEDARRIIDAAKPDVILFADCCPISHIAAKNAAMENLIPFIITCNVEAPYLAKRFPQVLPVCEKHYSYASNVICVSNSVLKMLREVFGLDEYQGEVIYYGRPEFYFSPKNLELRERLRAELSLPEDGILCFTSARIVEDKGHIYQIEAAKRLRDSGKLGQIYFAWAGTGALIEKYRELIKKDRLDKNIYLLEYRWDVVDWLSAADIFLLPSRVEALPLCVIEAMAKGLPVAASAVAGVPEEMGDTGCLLPDPNKAPQATVAKLAEILRLWSGDAELRKQVGAAAKERASRLFREEDMCARTIQLLAKAAEESQKSLAIRKMNSLCRSGEAKVFFEPYRKKLEESEPSGAAAGGDFPEFPPDEVEEIKNLASAWQADSSNAELLSALIQFRRSLAGFLINSNDLILGKLLGSSFGDVYRILLHCGLSHAMPDAEEKAFADQLSGGIKDSGDFSLSRLAASMLFTPAHLSPSILALEIFPKWFRKDYWGYVFKSVEVLHHREEAQTYSAHLLTWLRETARRMEKEPSGDLTRELAMAAMQSLNLIPCYCSPESNRELMGLRAKVIEFCLEKLGADLRMQPRARPGKRGNRKIRVGILNAHFGLQTETFVTMPAMQLEKSRFELHLFHCVKNPGPIEDRCRALADGMHLLPEAIGERVKMVRNANLDVIIVGTNISAVTNQIALLAAFRLAVLQIVSHCSPMTVGFKSCDAFLSGYLAYSPGLSEEEFHEKLILLDGPPVCLDYSCEPKVTAGAVPDRARLGIPVDAPVFFNAASCFKMPLELLQTWVRLLKEVPEAYLCLLPFNPNWTNKLPEVSFRRVLEGVLKEAGVESNRVVIGPSLPNRAAVMEFEKIADVYLDTFPFAGSISTVDPLQLGIPVVACDGKTTRSRCSGAQLREIGMEELVAKDEADYLQKAIRLARDLEHRKEVSARIQQAISRNPRFLDPHSYGRSLGAALEILVDEGTGALSDPVTFHKRLQEKSNVHVGNPQPAFQPISATLEVAISAFNAGRLAEAEDVCRELLQGDDRCAGAWNLMARMAALNGDLETAGDFGAVACELEPGNAGFVRFLADVNLGRGELESAEALVRRALEISPEDAASLALLGRVLCEKGEKADSLSAFQQALRLRKEDAEICAHYAQALQKMDRGKDAISQMRKAVSLAPDSVEHRTSLGMMLEENKRYADALASYEKALELRDDVGFVWHRKGKLLNGLQRYTEGAEALKRAIELPGATAEAHYDYGLALQMTKRVIEALEQYDRAASMGLDKHEMHCNRGVILKEINRHSDAIQAFYRAVRLAPDNEHYVNNLGAAALDIGLNSEALECFQDAVAANPNLQTAQNNIGNLLKDRGRGAEALPHYRRSMELAEGKFAASRLTKNNYLLCFQYLPEISPEAVFEEHRKWGMETVKLIRPAFNHTARKLPAGEKLRVGFVSADFCQHPVGVFMEPLLRELAGGRFEIFAYADYKQADSVSERMKATVPNWRETGSMSDAELAKVIHEDDIDVLFELTGHTALNRLDMFALKPAPVQATYLGYPSTTGLPTIDFRLTDAEADPAGMTEKFHIERMVRIAECAWCFSPHPGAPEIGPLPASQRGVVTFGCFNNMAKWNEPLYELWLEILRRVPGSRLKLKARTLLDNEVRGELEKWFVDRGIERERLEFTGHSKGIANHLTEYNKVDIALDSYPYHGTTTTCEALWMGCPVVTLEGPSHVSRVGVSLLKTVGLPDCIVKSREAYVEKAVELAGDLEALAALRAGMRDRLRASPLMDSSGFARRFENAIEEMVRLKKGN